MKSIHTENSFLIYGVFGLNFLVCAKHLVCHAEVTSSSQPTLLHSIDPDTVTPSPRCPGENVHCVRHWLNLGVRGTSQDVSRADEFWGTCWSPSVCTHWCISSHQHMKQFPILWPTYNCILIKLNKIVHQNLNWTR